MLTSPKQLMLTPPRSEHRVLASKTPVAPARPAGPVAPLVPLDPAAPCAP